MAQVHRDDLVAASQLEFGVNISKEYRIHQDPELLDSVIERSKRHRTCAEARMAQR